MWVNKGKATPVTHILEGNILEEDRFTHTSLTYYVHVAATVVVIEVNRFFGATEFVGTEENTFGWKLGRAIDLFYELALNLGIRDSALLWKVENRCKFDRI